MTKRSLRAIVSGAIVGVLAVGGALAGTVVSPLGTEETAVDERLPGAEEVREAAGLAASSSSSGDDEELAPEEIPDARDQGVSAPDGERLPDGTFLVGASRASLRPAPTVFGGERWQTEGCTAYEDGQIDSDHVLPPPDDALDEIRSWPASSPDCVYLGGFGIGPVRPATEVGHGGVWTRAVAISNGERTVIHGIADLVGWFARYDQTICADCGIRDVRERVASELGLDPGDVVFASTHSHATADTYGGWGGIPDWYRNQIRDAAIAAAKQAVANLTPATIDVGEAHLRDRNSERRDTYYSTTDTGATWLRARTLPPGSCGVDACPTETIATVATYAGHPTIVGENVLHADWPGAAARRFEDADGGVGLVFEGGLGNVSVSGVGGDDDQAEAEATGIAIADDVLADVADDPVRLQSNAIGAAVQDITHPTLTNPGLTTLATVGLFDREFTPGTPGAGLPGAYHWSKSGELSTSGEDNDAQPAGETLRGCTSAGPTVITTAGAHRIGEAMIAFAPGEIFSNIAEVVKEEADDNAVAMVWGQANDALGYIIQSFEYDAQGNAATEYGTGTGEYEEVFAVDRCIGDHVLETLLESADDLGFGR